MPSLINNMQASTYARLELDKKSRFLCAWIMPKCSVNSVAYLRYFRTIDGA